MNPEQDWIIKAKKAAAVEAAKHVRDGFIIGLGSGITAAYAIEEIGIRTKREKIHVLGVPTSYQAFMLAVKNGVPVTTLEEHPILDLAIDGADQVDSELRMIKGMGGALAREKIVAYSSKQNIIAVDKTKKVKVLGQNGQPVPIEVLPFAVHFVSQKLKDLGGEVVLREGKGKVGPVITDNGNLILDANLGLIRKPDEVACSLKAIPGVVETGIFADTANLVYIGKRSGVEKLMKQ